MERIVCNNNNDYLCRSGFLVIVDVTQIGLTGLLALAIAVIVTVAG